MDKKQIRKELSEKRKNIPKDKKAIFDKEISRKIIGSDYFKKASQVLIFASVSDEFDTRFIIEKCRTEYKRVFYPLCIDDQGEMKFLKVDSAGDLQIGMYNIPEPKKSCKEYRPQENDLIIVPCLSVDNNGYRMGYGKGYYDRFLLDYNGVTVGMCYAKCVHESLPKGYYDRPIDILITEKYISI